MFLSNPRPWCGSLGLGEPGCGNLRLGKTAKCGSLAASEEPSRGRRSTFEVQPGGLRGVRVASWEPKSGLFRPFVVTFEAFRKVGYHTLSSLFTRPSLLVVCGNLISRSIKEDKREGHTTPHGGAPMVCDNYTLLEPRVPPTTLPHRRLL